MYLKSLKLVGFKSFADRTRLEFRPGVTVIVGPNGSGKSNLVDALSWVLGTQAPKALRTGKMEDVVFAGTATRPSLNRAEAVLVIDNSDRQLPLDLEEVAITRRLYRDGSSDYEINGVGCRLLDIQELLSDSGVGRHQHIIIGQGQVDGVLNATPEDHRAVVEEAAGILKHRRRKEKAERRLERTDEDVLRLRDLLGEIERQLRPLRRQAKAASAYEGLRDEVRSLHLFISGRSLVEIDAAAAAAEQEHASLTGDVAGAEARLAEIDDATATLSALVAGFSSDLERDSGAAAVLETTMERLRRLSSVAHERSRALTGRRQARVERQADIESEQASIEAELSRIRPELAELSVLAESREDRFRRLEDEERALATQAALSPEGALAAVRGELSVLEAARARDQHEVEAVTERLKVVVGQADDERAEIAHINGEIQELDEEVGRLHAVYESASRARAADQKAWSAAEEELSTARLEVAAAGARVEAMRSAVAGGSDLESRKALLAEPGARGSVISMLDIPPGLESAVEAALGRWAESVAFRSPATMQSAVERVKSAGGGGWPVLVGSLDSPAAPAVEVARAAGVEALIDRLGDQADAALARRLLGDVLMVEGWAAAWSLVGSNPSLRAVTPEGDLVTADGIQLAGVGTRGPAMLEAAEAELEAANTALSRAQSIHTASSRDFEKSRDAERLALEALERVEASLAGRSEAMGRLQKSVDALEDETQRLESRRSSLSAAAGDRAEAIERLGRRLIALEGEEAQRVKVWEEMEARRATVAGQREEARADWQGAVAALTGMVERHRMLEERLSRLADEVGRSDEGETPSAARLDVVIGFAQRALDLLSPRLVELRDRQAMLRASHDEAAGSLAAAAAEQGSLRTRVGEGRERIGQLQVALTELRMRRQSVIEAIRRDADAGIEEALATERPDLPEGTDLQALLEERSAQLRRLGPINPLAAAEFADLDGRHRFLSEQLADVESSRAELRKVIKALEVEIEQRFQEAFVEVAAAYQRYFDVLFPGGRGSIHLTDSGDARSGLVIEAQPLGKKVGQLSLLSGGERSLAALAFLFSIFEARPSPFYVLDEVEAALDDANLRRFLKIVEEFRQRAQLLVVTHQQQTMEAADVLYGVTMEPGGSSQVVRKDMSLVGAALSDR